MKQLIDGVVVVMKATESRIESRLLARIEPLEKRQPEKGDRGEPGTHGSNGFDGKDGRDGKDVDPSVVQSLQSDVAAIREVQGAMSEVNRGLLTAVQTLRSDIDLSVADGVQKAVAAMPLPKNGADGRDGKDAPIPDVEEIAAKAAALVPVPASVEPLILSLQAEIATLKSSQEVSAAENAALVRSLDAIRAELEPIVSVHVDRAIAARPKPVDGKDGKSLTAEDVAPLIQAEVTKAAGNLRSGTDGVGITGALVDQDGVLRLTWSDGSMQKCGRVVGDPGKDADMAALLKHIDMELGKLPTPKDGAPGRDGSDGLGLDDLEEVLEDDGRVIVLRWKSGDRVKEFRHQTSTLLYRAVYVDGKQYERGDVVTWGGSTWHANTTTTSKPGDGSKDWQLVVKKGRDGRDGKNADVTPQMAVTGRRV